MILLGNRHQAIEQQISPSRGEIDIDSAPVRVFHSISVAWKSSKCCAKVAAHGRAKQYQQKEV